MSIFSGYGNLKDYYKKSPVTSIIIFAIFIMLLVTVVTGGFTGNNLVRLGALYPDLVKEGEYYRLFTVMFLHGGIEHFLSNTVIGLFVLSGTLERLIKSTRFIFVYLISGLGASLLITYTSSNLTVGASGAIFGVLGCLLYITVYRHDLISKPERKSIYALTVMQMLFTFISPGISIAGHIGGFISGFLISYLLISRKTPITIYTSNPQTPYYDIFEDFDRDDYS